MKTHLRNSARAKDNCANWNNSLHCALTANLGCFLESLSQEQLEYILKTNFSPLLTILKNACFCMFTPLPYSPHSSYPGENSFPGAERRTDYDYRICRPSNLMRNVFHSPKHAVCPRSCAHFFLFTAMFCASQGSHCLVTSSSS